MQVNPYAAPSADEIAQAETPSPVDELSVTYEINVEDLLAFQIYVHDHSATMRKTRVRGRYRLGLLLGLPAIVALFVGANMSALALLAYALYVIAVESLFARRGFVRSVRKYLRSAYAERSNRNLLGAHQITIRPNGIEMRMPLSTSISQWPAIDEIAEAEHHLFFFLTSLTAHAIPKQAFSTPEAMIRFRDAARRWHAAALGGSPVAPAS